MADSRRINSNIREEESKLSEEEQPPLSLSSIILSSEFWPPLKEEKLELPPMVCQAMEAYTHRYEKLKVDFCFTPNHSLSCSGGIGVLFTCGIFGAFMDSTTPVYVGFYTASLFAGFVFSRSWCP